MTEEIQRTPQQAFFAAFAKAQGQFKPIEKNRNVEIVMKTGGRYKFRYADLQTILAACVPALSENGLSIYSNLFDGEQHGMTLMVSLAHADGHIMSSRMPIDERGDIKEFGSRITYLRRYLVTALLGVASDDDADENEQEAGAGQPMRRQEPVPERKRPSPIERATEQPEGVATVAGSAEDTGELASAGERAWLNKKLAEREMAQYGEALTKAEFDRVKRTVLS
jgi:hypothetical protein